MDSIDVEKLLEPISADQPSGEDLEYDPAFAELERAAQGKPEQQFGATIIPAEEPSWREVRSQAIGLLARTKDVRVAVLLVRALVNTDGLAGLSDGLRLLNGLLDRYWETLYPRLDPDDDLDPTLRVNTIGAICDPATTLRSVRDAALVASPRMGRYSLRDVQIAMGAAPAPAGTEGKPPASLAAIEAAFTDCDPEALLATAAAVGACLEQAASIVRVVSDRVGASQSVDLSDLSKLLKSAQQILGEQLSRRGLAGAPTAPEVPSEEGAQPPMRSLASAPGGGAIADRDDVLRALDRICEYYARHEPSSPVPLLLNRAKRLVTKGFLDILRDLAPEGVSQVEALRGPEGE